MTAMKVTFIGQGNVATLFSEATRNSGHDVVMQNSHDVESLSDCSDLYVIAVSDNAIAEVASRMPRVKGVVVHTSGATDMDVLSRHENYGVLYPCQTFTKGDKIDFSTLPFLVEGNSESSVNVVRDFAESISKIVSFASSAQRAHFHVAAVMASNFVNRLIAKAKQHLDAQDLDYSFLRNLVEQTVEKAFTMDPIDAQTGPARRNDDHTINRHLSMIEDEDTRLIYNVITQSIRKQYEKF